MNLYVSTFDSDFIQGDDISIDGMVCECCPTSAVQCGNVSIVAYRDRNEAEVRNINILRRVNGEWSEPYAVNDDNWIISGCPVNGPKLAEKDEKLAIAWFTAPDGDSQINVAFSNDLGKTFSNPIRVDGGKPQGRVDLQWIDEKTIIATWLEANEENSSIVYRKIGTDGSKSEMNTIETLGGGRRIGYPQMEIVGNHILFLWTNPIEKTHIQSKWMKFFINFKTG